jgi:hypothetical protein
LVASLRKRVAFYAFTDRLPENFLHRPTFQFGAFAQHLSLGVGQPQGRRHVDHRPSRATAG